MVLANLKMKFCTLVAGRYALPAETYQLFPVPLTFSVEKSCALAVQNLHRPREERK